jgi:hypothetical protein
MEPKNPMGDAGNAASRFSSSKNVVKGYEYLHPDITRLLLTPASWSETEGCPFVVDSESLVLQKQSDEMDSYSSEFMPLHQLAYCAEECERAVFRTQLKQRYSDNGVKKVPGKIMGLICLSQLSLDWFEPDNDANNAPVTNNDPGSAILVATMVSLNLLESSIRSAVREFNLVKSNCESSKKNSAGAPLLRDMIETLSELDINEKVQNRGTSSLNFNILTAILRALLLPTRLSGTSLNLRNVISHGFVSTVDRRWLALVLVLIQTLDNAVYPSDGKSSNCKRDSLATADLKRYKPMANIVSRGKVLFVEGSNDLVVKLTSDLIPVAYKNMTHFIFGVLARPLKKSLEGKSTCQSSPIPNSIGLVSYNNIPSLTAIFLIAVSSLLEHSLRLKWCQANNKPDESIARPSKYYVTLDGHGQRDKHDIMISPYLVDGSKNLLLPKIGAAAALLSDLFAAPSSEAPNIRSQLCHGTWDAEVVRELESLAMWKLAQSGGSCNETEISSTECSSNDFLADAAFAIAASFEMLSYNSSNGAELTGYQPVYSYVAIWTRNLDSSINDLVLLQRLVSNNSIIECMRKLSCKQSTEISYRLDALKLDLDVIRQMQQDCFLSSESSVDAQDIWSVYDKNVALSECIAAQTLLSETSNAVKRYISYVQAALNLLSLKPTSTKEKRGLKTMTRLCGMANIVLDFFTLSVYVCLFMIKNELQLRDNMSTDEDRWTRSDCVKLVERTRMTLSTFDIYMWNNLDRSLKALGQYLQGKALRKLSMWGSSPLLS